MTEVGLVFLGVILAACGGATLSLAMVTQRYALDLNVNDGNPKVPFIFGNTLPRNLVWFFGLVLYGAANGFYALALLYGPLSLLAGLVLVERIATLSFFLSIACILYSLRASFTSINCLPTSFLLYLPL